MISFLLGLNYSGERFIEAVAIVVMEVEEGDRSGMEEKDIGEGRRGGRDGKKGGKKGGGRAREGESEAGRE